MKQLLIASLILFSVSLQAQITVRELSVQLPDVCLDSIQDPQPGEVAFSDSTLWYCDGVNWIDVGSSIECQSRVKLGYGTFNGDPSQSDFIAIFGELDYFYQFTVKAGS